MSSDERANKLDGVHGGDDCRNQFRIPLPVFDIAMMEEGRRSVVLHGAAEAFYALGGERRCSPCLDHRRRSATAFSADHGSDQGAAVALPEDLPNVVLVEEDHMSQIVLGDDQGSSAVCLGLSV